MNKCSCVYVAAVKLTLSDLAHECLFDKENIRKTTDEFYTSTHTPTSQLFLVTKINL